MRFLEICAEIFEMGVGDTNLLWVCGWGVFVCGVGGWRGGEGVRFWDFSLNLPYNYLVYNCRIMLYNDDYSIMWYNIKII